MNEGDLFRVRGSVSHDGGSVELAVGGNAPSALARLMPRASARRRATQVVSARILEKISEETPLSEADVLYAEEIFGEAEARWMRRRQIEERATVLLHDLPRAMALLPGQEESSRTTTSEDWVSRFWDDAELASDEIVQEIYSRILAAEATRPGTCSLGTLRVLRYLDRDIGEKFSALTPLIFSGEWVLRDDELLKKHGLAYDDILDLDDAGLVESSATIVQTFEEDTGYITYGDRIMKIENTQRFQIPIYSLKRPARELARIAAVDRTDEALIMLADWLLTRRTTLRVSWAISTGPWDGIAPLAWTQRSVEEAFAPTSEATQESPPNSR